MERMQKTYGERRAGTETRHRGQIRRVQYLQSFFEIEELQTFAHRGMLDLVMRPGILGPRIADPVAGVEERREVPHGQIAVLVYRSAQDGASVFFVPGGIVGSSTEKGDAEWSARDYHSWLSDFRFEMLPPIVVRILQCLRKRYRRLPAGRFFKFLR